MRIIQVKTQKLFIIKKRLNNKVSFVEFIFNSRLDITVNWLSMHRIIIIIIIIKKKIIIISVAPDVEPDL